METNQESLKSLKARAQDLPALLRLGKAGLTPQIIAEADKLLTAKELVKIKMLRSGIGDTPKEEIISKFVESTNATLIHKVGLTFTIYRKNPKKIA